MMRYTYECPTQSRAVQKLGTKRIRPGALLAASSWKLNWGANRLQQHHTVASIHPAAWNGILISAQDNQLCNSITVLQ